MWYGVSTLADIFLRPSVSLQGTTMAVLIYSACFLVYPRPYRPAHAVSGALLLLAILVAPMLPGDAKDGLKVAPGEAVFNLFAGIAIPVGGMANNLVILRSFRAVTARDHV